MARIVHSHQKLAPPGHRLISEEFRQLDHFVRQAMADDELSDEDAEVPGAPEAAEPVESPRRLGR